MGESGIHVSTSLIALGKESEEPASIMSDIEEINIDYLEKPSENQMFGLS